MQRGPSGHFEVITSTGEPVRAFVPAPLPPTPSLDLSGSRQRLLEQALLALFRDDAAKVQTLGRAAANALRLFNALRARPLTTQNDLAKRTGASYPTVSRAVQALEKLGIVSEITGRKRERVFAYRAYLAILNEGTEPL